MILIVGGAGYVGSHMAKMLNSLGWSVVVLDNLSTGFRDAACYGEFVEGDLADGDVLNALFEKYDFKAVMHFAASSLVGESVVNPLKYYRNNISNTLNLLEAMAKNNVNNIIFSSTAAIFGEPKHTPIDELHPQIPINPYGFSKLAVERILSDFSKAYGINSVSLRYFNASGADPEGELGECHNPETHLVPLILQAASGRRDNISVFGRDYSTIDGTCVRDYIHITDLCSAHNLALNGLLDGLITGAAAYNLGNGNGFSVQQVINAANKVVEVDGYSICTQDSARRAGDPAILVADASKAKLELGWEPKYSNLDVILNHAWQWEKRLSGIV